MTETENPSQRVLRVFVSSTFRDMQDERDELVKRVFPKLRELCESRGVVWGEVDLRWGITTEQAAEGQVLPICLAEIRNCRPYFLGLLGERYGWVPEHIDASLVEQEPWLADHVGRSVTELEIIEGVLRNRAMAGHAYFYFRDPAYSNRHEAFTEAPGPVEVAQLGFDEAQRRAEARRARLVALKDRIRSGGFPVRENYSDPRSLGDLVLADLTSLVNDLFPVGSTPTPAELERGLHEAFARSRSAVYITRPVYFERLDDFASGTEPPLVVVGESGMGKSALLASWSLEWKERHAKPESTGDSLPGVLLMHFVAASPASSDWAAMLRRIMAELNDHFNLDVEIPDEAEALRRAFADSLHRVAAKGKALLVIDALNQLEDTEGALDLVWLPPVIPGNVRIVLSTLPGRAQDELARRGWPTLRVEPLNVAERDELISSYLYGEYRKTLAPLLSERVANAPQSANPLFLRTMLEELRLFGEHETVEQRLHALLGAPDVPTLYELVLERLESDYERDRPGLVKDALTMIFATRHGLTETEVLELLGEADKPLPQRIWSPLYLASKPMLSNHGGMLQFAHDYARAAVESRYLRDDAKVAIHLRLAWYFGLRTQASSCELPRELQELPWQLSQAHAWPLLVELLAQPAFIGALWKVAHRDVRRYWVEIEANSSLRMEDAYRSLEDAPSDVEVDHLDSVASLLEKNGRLAQALKLREQVTYRLQQLSEPQPLALAYSLERQGAILRDRGDLDEAMELFAQVERVCREVGEQNILAGSLYHQARILIGRHELDRAMELLEQAERISRELGDASGLSLARATQAAIFDMRGELDRAMPLYRERERMCRALGDRDALQSCLGSQAWNFRHRGDLDGAMQLYREQEQICRELGSRKDLELCLFNQVEILAERGDLDGATELLNEQERICRDLGDQDRLQECLGSQAAIRQLRGDLDGALALRQDQARICRECGYTAALQKSLHGQRLVQHHRGDLVAAMEVCEEQVQLARELGTLDRLQSSFAHEAADRIETNDLAGALALFKKQAEICDELGNLNALQQSLGNQAVILYKQGDLNGALALHTEQEMICRELDDTGALQHCLGQQGAILTDLQHFSDAMERYKTQERICSERGNSEDLVSCLVSQATTLGEWARAMHRSGRLVDALGLFRGQERIYREVAESNRLVACLYNLGVILESCARLDEALAVWSERERICRGIEDLDGLQASLRRAASIRCERGELDQASNLIGESERICRECGNREGLIKALNTSSLILHDRGDLEGSLAKMQEQERICQQIGDGVGLQNSLDGQARILRALRRTRRPWTRK